MDLLAFSNISCSSAKSNIIMGCALGKIKSITNHVMKDWPFEVLIVWVLVLVENYGIMVFMALDGW